MAQTFSKTTTKPSQKKQVIILVVLGIVIDRKSVV